MSALDVACPSCKARKGSLCVRERLVWKNGASVGKVPTSTIHTRRYEARIAELEGRR